MDQSDITLPLPANVSRCLGQGERQFLRCQRSGACARFQTTQHDNEPWPDAPPAYRACADETFSLFMEYKK